LFLLARRVVSGLLTGFFVFVCHFFPQRLFPKNIFRVSFYIGTISY
jgi:hypothetical protein